MPSTQMEQVTSELSSLRLSASIAFAVSSASMALAEWSEWCDNVDSWRTIIAGLGLAIALSTCFGGSEGALN